MSTIINEAGPQAETSVIRRNLMSEPGYTPYCGNVKCHGHMPRTGFDGAQFQCPRCQWRSGFPPEFIARYLQRWAKTPQAGMGDESKK